MAVCWRRLLLRTAAMLWAAACWAEKASCVGDACLARNITLAGGRSGAQLDALARIRPFPRLAYSCARGDRVLLGNQSATVIDLSVPNQMAYGFFHSLVNGAVRTADRAGSRGRTDNCPRVGSRASQRWICALRSQPSRPDLC